MLNKEELLELANRLDRQLSAADLEGHNWLKDDLRVFIEDVKDYIEGD